MMRTLLLGGLVGLLAAGAALLWLLPGNSADGAASGAAPVRAPVAVETAPVGTGAISASRRFGGTLRARSEFDVAPKTGGRLAEVLVDVGDAVQRGQLLARLDDHEAVQAERQARAELAVAQASLAEARSQRTLAQRDLERTRELHQQGIAATAELDAAAAQARAQAARVDLAQAQVAQRQAALRAASVRLDYTRVRADWQGDDDSRLVGQRYLDPGATVAANTPILSVLDLATLRARIHVGERAYARLVPGQAVRLYTAAWPGEAFEGRISRIAPRFDEASRQAEVEVAVDNAHRRLRPGLYVEVVIELERVEAARRVPLAALVERDGAAGLYRVTRTPRGPVADFVQLRLGLRGTEYVQVLDPPLEGEVVVLGQHLLRDGARVQVGALPEPSGP